MTMRTFYLQGLTANENLFVNWVFYKKFYITSLHWMGYKELSYVKVSWVSLVGKPLIWLSLSSQLRQGASSGLFLRNPVVLLDFLRNLENAWIELENIIYLSMISSNQTILKPIKSWSLDFLTLLALRGAASYKTSRVTLFPYIFLTLTYKELPTSTRMSAPCIVIALAMSKGGRVASSLW